MAHIAHGQNRSKLNLLHQFLFHLDIFLLMQEDIKKILIGGPDRSSLYVKLPVDLIIRPIFLLYINLEETNPCPLLASSILFQENLNQSRTDVLATFRAESLRMIYTSYMSVDPSHDVVIIDGIGWITLMSAIHLVSILLEHNARSRNRWPLTLR